MIFDCHAHIFPENVVDRAMEALSARYGAEPVGRATPAGLLRHMDDCGVDRCLVLGVATKPSQVRPINDWLTGLGEERLVPLGSLHPHMDGMADEIARLVDCDVKGVKLQPHFQDYELDDPAVHAMFEAIGDRLFVLMHGGQEIIPIDNLQPTPPRLARLLDTHPQVRFIFAHLGAYLQWDEVEETLVGRDAYLDASYVFDICSDQQIRRIIQGHGPERIVWGSDFPWQTQAQGLAGIRRLGFGADVEKGILGGNLLRLLEM
ncbi:MAG: amidohydrolase family protein [Armatimonadetes bacterium]|nr:amidohydrolase family protein [Armatimonadota bacterium]MDI9584073.1 amidohydrolase family protein [Acidobacteriota bacterium]